MYPNKNAEPFCSAWVASASAKYYPKACPLPRPRLHRDMYSGPPKGNISFIFATTATSISMPAPRQAPTVSPWGPNKSPSAQAFRSTDTLRMDEAFYVLEGSGIVTLNDVPHTFEKGGTIFIPRNSWHGFSNPDHELLLLWIMSPAGLDGFFRETCSPPGVPPKQLTREQIREIALKYGTEFR